MISRLGFVPFLAAAATTWATPATAADPMDEIPFAIASEGGLFWEARNDGRQGGHGDWALLEGRLGPRVLHLKLRIEPPWNGLPVDAGPAVLFAGLSLYGDAGGDVATGGRVRSLAAVTIAPCQGPGCQSDVEIDLPLDDLPAAIKRMEKNGSLIWVSAELTFVRTFAGGTWLQVLPFMPVDAPIDARAGRLGAVEPAKGALFPFGLFPAAQATPVPPDPELFPRGFDYAAAVETRRSAAGDGSLPLATAPAFLRITIAPACNGSFVLTLHDERGDRVFDRPLEHVTSIEEQLQLPIGVPWWFTLHDGGGIDFDQGRQGTGARVGPIGTTEQPITVDAAFDCSVPHGVVRVDGAVVGPTQAPATPATTAGPAAPEGPALSPGTATPPQGQRAGGSSGQPIVAVLALLVGLLLLVTFGRRSDDRS